MTPSCLLESMQDGVLYSNILLKLYLKSLKHGGRLQLDENIPYTAQMIATITRQQIGTVERALANLPEAGPCGSAGQRHLLHEQYRTAESASPPPRPSESGRQGSQNKALSAPRTNGGHLSDIRPPEIEIELEKEIEIKREIEKGHPARTYGRYQNVFLTDEELADLQASFPTVWGQYIEKAVRVHGFYRQAVSEPCRHHPALGQRGRQGKRPRPPATGITA